MTTNELSFNPGKLDKGILENHLKSLECQNIWFDEFAHTHSFDNPNINPFSLICRTSKNMPDIMNVIFNDRATIVFWSDGTKTAVVCNEGETYDKWYGIAMCHMKRLYGNGYEACKVCENWEDLKENKEHFSKLIKHYRSNKDDFEVIYEFTKKFLKSYDNEFKTNFSSRRIPKMKDSKNLAKMIIDSVEDSINNDYITKAIIALEKCANIILIERDRKSKNEIVTEESK